MHAAKQIQIGQNSLTARNNTGARRESEPTQTVSGPESLNSTTSPGSALSLLLEEVQETVSNCLQKMKWMRNISFEVNRRLESSFGQERKGSSLCYGHAKGV